MIDNPPEQHPRPPLSFTVAWTMFTLTSFFTVGVVAQLLNAPWGLWVSELTIFAGLTVIGFQVLGVKPLPAMGLQRFDARTFGLGLLLGVVNYFAWAVPLTEAAHAVFPAWMVEASDVSQSLERLTSFELALFIAAATVAAPLGEEFIYRGFMQRGLELSHGPRVAIAVTALVFSLSHLDLVGFTARLELGLLFGLLAWHAGSLWPAIAAHLANNLTTLLLFLTAGDTAKEGASPWWITVGMLVLGNLSLFGLFRFAWPHLQAAEPRVVIDVPVRSPRWLFFPWVMAGLVSLIVLLAIDLRGVQLNVLDLRLQVAKPIRERDDVKELRARVRRGEAELNDYETYVRSLTSP